jgi:hypothetical protein
MYIVEGTFTLYIPYRSVYIIKNLTDTIYNRRWRKKYEAAFRFGMKEGIG